MFANLAARLSRPAVERRFLVAVVLFLLALGIRTGFKAAENRSAFSRWHSQVSRLSEGIDLSAAFNYPNPPIMAVLFEPFTWLPRVPGALVWFAVKAALALLALYWVVRLVEGSGPPFPPWGRMLLVLCSLKPIVDDLAHGNVNLIILFLVIAALTAYRQHRDLLAGGLLALAIACKVTPGLFLVYFAWKRSWRLLTGCAAGLMLFLLPGVVPILRMGQENYQQQLTSWYRVMVHPFLIEGKVTSEHLNQSLPGLVTRLATSSPSFVTFDGDTEVAVRHDNLLALPPRTARGIVQGCLALFLLTAAWTCRTPADRRDGWPRAAEFSLVVLGMLLFSERTWKHHAVTLVLPYAVLIYLLAAVPLSRGWRTKLTAVFVTAVVLMTLPGLGLGVRDRLAAEVWPGLAKMAQVYGSCTWAFLLLAGGLVVLLRRVDSVGCPPDSPALSSNTAPRTIPPAPDGTFPWPLPVPPAVSVSRVAVSCSGPPPGLPRRRP